MNIGRYTWKRKSNKRNDMHNCKQTKFEVLFATYIKSHMIVKKNVIKM